MKIVLTGGGTGGHIYPALAVGSYLSNKGHKIVYIGGVNKLEAELALESGFPFYGISVAPLPRKISINLFKNIFTNFKGILQAYRLMRQIKPDLVLGTGGYVAGPVVLAASLAGKKTIIHEQNAYPGISNKLLARFADEIALNFAAAKKYLPENVLAKTVITGNPVRQQIITTTRERAALGLKLNPNLKTVVISGGSQGARSINEAVIGIYKKIIKDDRFQLIHLTGKSNYQQMLDLLTEQGLGERPKRLKILPYLHQMDWAYAMADLIVYRAGATGLAEITARGVAAVLIPFPYAAEDHQVVNAQALVNQGAAIMIQEKNLSEKKLTSTVFSLLNDDKKRADMAKASAKLGNPQALEKLVELIEAINRENINS